jgi:hypothetical protein
MRAALKLNEIEQEHLQELFDAAGVPRDMLPYTEEYIQFIEDFQNRTFKNADGEQVFGALLKYCRTGGHPIGDIGPSPVDKEKLKNLKAALRRHAKGGKVLPHSQEIESARKEFNSASGLGLAERDFWMAILHTQSRSRRPPPRRVKVAVAAEDDGDDAE